MLRILLLTAATALPAISFGAPSTAPLVLQFPETMQAGSHTGVAPGIAVALIGAWANAAMDKQSARQVGAFREQTAGFDFAAAVQEALRCVGVAEPRTACRELLTLPASDDEEDLAAQLSARGISELVTVNVVPLLTDTRFRVRAFARELSVTSKGLRTSREYGAIYDSRAPQSLIDGDDADRLREYWREGDPPRLRREALAASQELEHALSFLSDSLEANGGKPGFAKQLPPIKDLQSSGRVACRGMPCAQVRVVRGSRSRLWFTSTAAAGSPSPVIASLDENSAKHSVNIFMLVATLE